MISFFRYIFCKSYHFCINVFKEDEFPFYWATSSVVILIFANIVSIMGFLKYVFYPYGFDNYSEYQKYVIILLLAVSNIYMYQRKRYLRYVNFCEKLSVPKARVYRILSILYYLISIYAFFKSGYLIRSLLGS